MKEILVFAGTTEGRKLSEYLAAANVAHTVCVATEYGEIVLQENSLVQVHRGRMNQEEIKNFIQSGKFDVVIDATHPYAELVTMNIQAAIQDLDVSYLRLNRTLHADTQQGKVFFFDTNKACAKALEETQGNILLTTGSKELAEYCTFEHVKNRLFVRVLPSVESITLCNKQGICGQQILAMQGPFTTELNEAIIRQYKISCLVTKQSGSLGGYQEKLDAAKNTDISVFVVGRSKKEGYSFLEICEQLEKICGLEQKKSRQMNIILAGIGMGNKRCLTREVQDAIEQADILLGAKRMLAFFEPKIEKRPYYLAEQIIPYLKEVQEKNLFLEDRNVVVLFSGDTGFYSGCGALHHALLEEIEKGQLHACVRILPGISSVAYLAACIGEDYQDADIYSLHGKKINHLARKVMYAEKTYCLTSGVKDINMLGQCLVEAGMSECEVTVGFALSYPEQKIMQLTPKQCCEITNDGLYTCFIKNPNPICQKLTHGISDNAFIRGKVPMTKEEIREISICKLKMHKNAIVYDIGSGTGSIAVELATLHDDVQVYAIEHKSVATSLIEENRQKFGLENIVIVEAQAPEGFAHLNVPTHAFIGGSGGKMKEILSALYQLNSKMRVVINAISLETLCELREILSAYHLKDEELVQVQVSRAKQIGQYHLIEAENPVWICAFYFREQ